MTFAQSFLFFETGSHYCPTTPGLLSSLTGRRGRAAPAWLTGEEQVAAAEADVKDRDTGAQTSAGGTEDGVTG